MKELFSNTEANCPLCTNEGCLFVTVTRKDMVNYPDQCVTRVLMQCFRCYRHYEITWIEERKEMAGNDGN